MNKKDSFFLRSVLTLFLILWIPVAGLLIVNGVLDLKQDRAEYNLSSQKSADTYAEKVHTFFRQLVDNCNCIFNFRWYTHYMNAEGVYDSEFDTLKKNEISYQLRTLVNSVSFAEDILIVSPDHNKVITQNGWYSFDEYNRYYSSAARVRTDGYNVQVEPADGCLSIVLSDITTRKHKGYVCILFSQTELKNYALEYLPETLHDVSIHAGDTVWIEGLYSVQQDSADQFSIIKYGLPQMKFRFSPVSYSESILPARISVLVLMLAATTIFLFSISWFGNHLLVNPISRLLQRYSSGRVHSFNEAYRQLDQYMEAVSYKTIELSDENSNLKKTIHSFVERSETESLLCLLLSRTEPGDLKTVLPKNWEERRFIIVLIGNNAASAASSPAWVSRMPAFCLETQLLHVLTYEYCLVTWVADGISEQTLLSELSAFFDRELDPDQTFLCSDVINDLYRLHTEYSTLQKAFNMRSEAEKVLPSDIQLDLLSHIKSGRFEQCLKTIESMRTQYQPDHLFIFLLHTASESGIDTESLRKLYLQNDSSEVNRWNIVIDLACLLADHSLSEHRNFVTDTAGLMQAYVDDNYSNPDISIRLLAECFHIDSTQASKVFKAGSNMNFTDYLLEKRMENALKLMSSSSMSLQTISEQVGYASYLTFKRAFIRYRGINPREYRALFLDVRDSTEPSPDAPELPVSPSDTTDGM